MTQRERTIDGVTKTIIYMAPLERDPLNPMAYEKKKSFCLGFDCAH